MSNNFEQISIKPGFMKHNGGILFRTISDNEYEFKSLVNKNISFGPVGHLVEITNFFRAKPSIKTFGKPSVLEVKIKISDFKR